MAEQRLETIVFVIAVILIELAIVLIYAFTFDYQSMQFINVLIIQQTAVIFEKNFFSFRLKKKKHSKKIAFSWHQWIWGKRVTHLWLFPRRQHYDFLWFWFPHDFPSPLRLQCRWLRTPDFFHCHPIGSVGPRHVLYGQWSHCCPFLYLRTWIVRTNRWIVLLWCSHDFFWRNYWKGKKENVHCLSKFFLV